MTVRGANSPNAFGYTRARHVRYLFVGAKTFAGHFIDQVTIYSPYRPPLISTVNVVILTVTTTNHDNHKARDSSCYD